MFTDYKHLHLQRAAVVLGIVFCLYTLTTSLAKASDTKFTGFASFGLTYAKSDEFEFRSSLINSPREGLSWQADTIVGLQMNSRLDEKFDFVGQVILQDRNDYAVTNLLELAFIRYQMNRNWSARVGRFSTNSYLLTDYRYVRHVQAWVRPPLEMYSQTGSLGNMNGLQINYVKDVNFGTLKVSGSIGRSEFRNDRDDGKFRITYQDINSLTIELQTSQWRVQAAHITAILDDLIFTGVEEVRNLDLTIPLIFRPLAFEIQSTLLPEGARASYSSVGAIYQGDELEFIAEIADYDSQWAMSQSSKQGYVSLAYRFDDFIAFITASFVNRKKFPQIIDFEQAEQDFPPALYEQVLLLSADADNILRSSSIDQDSISIGLRWDINLDWALKLQFDHNRINDSGSGLFSLLGDANAPREKRRFNVVNLSLTTTF